MDFKVVDSRIFALEDRLGPEKAHEKAGELKGKAFGAIDKIFSLGKKEGIEIRYVEKRFEPFWHILYRTHLEYERGKEYEIEVDSVVKAVVFDGKEHGCEAGKIRFQAVEHCVEDLSREVFIDAVSGEACRCEKHVEYPKKEIKETEELFSEDVIVVPAKIKASYLTRNVVSEMLKPVKADEVTVEEIRVEKLHLYFRPTYAFEYFWTEKNKAAVLEFDAVTFEVRHGGKALRQKMKELFAEKDLFEIGSDAVDLLVPGGGVALKLARRAVAKK